MRTIVRNRKKVRSKGKGTGKLQTTKRVNESEITERNEEVRKKRQKC